MKQLKRAMSLAVLVGFIGLAAAEASHGHKSFVAKLDTECCVCKLAHQTPLLTSDANTPAPILETSEAAPAESAPLDLAFAATTHGLSPPTL